MSFKAIWLTQDAADGAGGFAARVETFDDARLPAEANVLVEVAWSALNYKDALALTNRAPVVRRWPMIPGIEGAGVVVASDDPNWRPGDEVVALGCGLGEGHWGGLAQRARWHGDWLVPLPTGMTLRQAMAAGTAGFTAALSLAAIERHGVRPGDGELLVTGATGGVGSLAILLAAACGWRVVASTGKADAAGYLRELGAAEVIDRAVLSRPLSDKPLQKERWAATIDAVGSHTLANVLAQTRRHGVVAACGRAQGMDLPTTVAPFILRGVALTGIDSGFAPLPARDDAWRRVARDLDLDRLDALTRTVPLAGVFDAAAAQLRGEVRGRVVVDVNA